MAESARTPEKDDAFFAALGTGMIIMKAAKAAGYSTPRVYEYRKNDPEFGKRWAEAIEEATQLLEEEADRRGRDGVAKPLFHKGKPIMMADADGVERPVFVREYSDTLLIFRLKALRPDVYRERVEMKGEMSINGLADRLQAARDKLKGGKGK